MSRNQIIFWIGLLIIGTAFSGLPAMYKFWVYVLAGLFLIILSLRNWIIRSFRESRFHGYHPDSTSSVNNNSSNS